MFFPLRQQPFNAGTISGQRLAAADSGIRRLLRRRKTPLASWRTALSPPRASVSTDTPLTKVCQAPMWMPSPALTAAPPRISAMSVVGAAHVDDDRFLFAGQRLTPTIEAPGATGWSPPAGRL
jgi:hypothetical protein